jgi:hypothetical protein
MKKARPLSLIDAVAALVAPEPPQVRVGVVVGDIVGSGGAQERGIVGWMLSGPSA